MRIKRRCYEWQSMAACRGTWARITSYSVWKMANSDTRDSKLVRGIGYLWIVAWGVTPPTAQALDERLDDLFDAAGFDEGPLPLSLPVLVYMHHPCSDIK